MYDTKARPWHVMVVLPRRRQRGSRSPGSNLLAVVFPTVAPPGSVSRKSVEEMLHASLEARLGHRVPGGVDVAACGIDLHADGHGRGGLLEIAGMDGLRSDRVVKDAGLDIEAGREALFRGRRDVAAWLVRRRGVTGQIADGQD